jgi:large subunit ribosomal protein L10
VSKVLKSEKEVLSKELNDKFTRAKSVVIAEFKKLDVETVNKLRRKLREGKVEWKVLKNTIARRAAKGTSVELVSDDFVGPVAAAISYEDVVAPAKILAEFSKDLQSITIKSGVVQGVINMPAGKLVRTIAEPANALARVLKAKADKQ